MCLRPTAVQITRKTWLYVLTVAGLSIRNAVCWTASYTSISYTYSFVTADNLLKLFQNLIFLNIFQDTIKVWSKYALLQWNVNQIMKWKLSLCFSDYYTSWCHGLLTLDILQTRLQFTFLFCNRTRLHVTTKYEMINHFQRGPFFGLNVLNPFLSVSATTPTGLLASYWNLPMYSQASSDPNLADKNVFKTLVRLGPPFNKMGKALVEMFKHFNWDTVVMVTKRKTDNQNVFCDYSARSVVEEFRDNAIAINDNVEINPGISDYEIKAVLERIKGRGRSKYYIMSPVFGSCPTRQYSNLPARLQKLAGDFRILRWATIETLLSRRRITNALIRMRSLICDFVVPIKYKQVFSWRCSYVSWKSWWYDFKQFYIPFFREHRSWKYTF